MGKKVFEDGICDTCGNTGLAGEKCLNCGGTLVALDPRVDTLDESKKGPETYPEEVMKTGSSEDLLEEKFE